MQSFEGLTLPSLEEKIAKADWVDMRLVRVFMRDTTRSLYFTIFLAFVVGAVLFGGVAFSQITLWIGLLVSLSVARLWVTRAYHSTMRGVSGQSLVAFMRRYEWLWPLSAAVWGGSVWLFFLKASVFDQFMCLLMLIGVCSLSVNSFGARLRCVLAFIDALHVSVLSALMFRLFTFEAGVTWSGDLLALGLLVLAYWFLIRVAAKRFNQMLRSGFELEYDNTTLITSLTEKSRAAQQAVTTKNRFIASAAHDLRQPLHALNLYASWLKNEPDLTPVITPKIIRSTQVLDELFDSLFYFSGLDSDPLRVQMQPVCLEGLFRDMKLQYEVAATEKKLTFVAASQPGMLWTDPLLLKRLLGNYLSNAIKHTQRGTVVLSVKIHKTKWRIEVTDTGPGIAAEHHQGIFEEFYRAPASGTEEGFGLGLAIVDRLGVALQHRVGVKSNVGLGSVFWVEGSLAPDGTVPLGL